MVIKIIPNQINKLENNQIFVFGANTEGRHGKGSALDARKFGAVYGQSSGLQGNSYGIITKDLNKGLRSIPLSEIKLQIDELCEVARSTKNKDYLLTPIGIGNAGYSVSEIADLIPTDIPSNIWLPQCFAHHHLPKNIMDVMFTLDRTQKFENITEREDAYSHLDKLIQHAIKRAIEWGYDAINFVSGMALGLDTAACEFVLAEKLRGRSLEIILTAALPCLDQDIKWHQNDKAKYKYLLSKCDFAQYVSNLNYSNAGNASCLDRRNKWMISQLVRSHDMAMAIHNGQAGGTQNAINDLVKSNKRIIMYNYKSQKYIKLGSW